MISLQIGVLCPYVTLKTKVTPPQRARYKSHEPWVYLEKATGAVYFAHYTCMAWYGLKMYIKLIAYQIYILDQTMNIFKTWNNIINVFFSFPYYMILLMDILNILEKFAVIQSRNGSENSIDKVKLYQRGMWVEQYISEGDKYYLIKQDFLIEPCLVSLCWFLLVNIYTNFNPSINWIY